MFYSADGVSGWSETSKLVSSDATASTIFGSSVSVWGNAVAVGDTNANTPARSYTGTLRREISIARILCLKFMLMYTCLPRVTIFCNIISGAAYVFYSADGISGWSQASKLVASDASSYDDFGCSVSLKGNVISVGACSADTSGLYISGKCYFYDLCMSFFI